MIIVKIQYRIPEGAAGRTLAYEMVVASKDTARVARDMALAYFKKEKINSYRIEANDGEGQTVPVGVETLDF